MILEDQIQMQEKTLASFAKRTAAFSIDEIIITTLLLIAHYDIFSSLSAGSPAVVLNFISSLILQIYFLKIVYDTFFTWMYGATPGKMIMNIKVVSIYDFEKPNLYFCIIRSIGKIISSALFYLGFIWILFDPNKQSWQDKAAKTIVIHD